MCEQCYAEIGSPAIVSEKTRAAAALIARVFEFSDVSGNLHAQLDDCNMGDQHFFGEFKQYLDPKLTWPGQIEAERECYAALKALTVEERWSALAIHEGWVDIGQKIGQSV